ncbi:MAG TPA: DUF6088 family protein [Candidatus Elarobacter sp.]|jgi:hypothetical protein|nr:DUF6088 family protein [Candidatus Elarobacter sp.]
MANVGSAAAKIGAYIGRLTPGTVFTPAELVSKNLGTPTTVRQTLRRLAAKGTIRRLSTGYYDVPKTSAKIGVLSPTRDAIISAIARKTGAKIEKPQLDAANALGLTDQVVARPAYRTDLTNRRRITIGGQTVDLMPTGPRSLGRDDDVTEQIIDALKALGPRHIEERHLQKLQEIVDTPELRKSLRNRAKRAPQWIASVVARITQS